MKVFEKKSKEQKLIDYFIKRKEITSWTAITKFRLTRLSGIIFRLRKKGWQIETERKGKENYAVYKLVSYPERKVSENEKHKINISM